jgi:parallel beta-helix repeat protein
MIILVSFTGISYSQLDKLDKTKFSQTELIIQGPAVGKVNISYYYDIYLLNPEGEFVFFRFELGDGEWTDWIGPYSSNEKFNLRRYWEECGIYTFQVEAKCNGTYNSSFEVIIIDGNILHVGGNGQNNFSKIQDALDNTSNGDAVFIHEYSSPYYENIVINKSISLIGENRDNTVIDGSERGDVITVNSNNISIYKLTIQRDGWYDDGIRLNANKSTIISNYFINNGAGVYSFKTNSHTIISNEFFDNHDGIKIIESNENQIISNNFYENYFSGVALFNCDNNNCSSNEIYGNTFLAIQHSYNGFRVLNSNNNTFYNNTIVSILDNCNAGIDLWESNNNYLIENKFIKNGLVWYKSFNSTLKNNTVNGKPLVYLVDKFDQIIDNAGQVILVDCNDITIKNIQLINVEVGIDFINSLNCEIENNSISKCWYGIRLESSKGIEILNNTINNNSYGIKLDLLSSQNMLMNNHISSNKYHGILCGGAHNSINNNIIEDSPVGIYLGGIFCRANMIFSNYIANNYFGIHIRSSNSNTIFSNTIINNRNGVNLSLSLTNIFKKNNFKDNIIHAVFTNSFLNRWKNNYWDNDKISPHIIKGKIRLVKHHPWSGAIIWEKRIPMYNFDWIVSKKPYQS